MASRRRSRRRRASPATSVRVTVRRARAADFRRVAELSGQLGYPTTNAQGRRRLSAVLRRRKHVVWTALDRSGEVVGWIHVFCAPHIVADSQAELGGLVVDARIRGRGVGRRLIREAERWARRRGCRALRVRANVVRKDAHPFYRRLGYRLVKTQLVFHKRLGPARRA